METGERGADGEGGRRELEKRRVDEKEIEGEKRKLFGEGERRLERRERGKRERRRTDGEEEEEYRACA
eukprot:1332077-Amorphochlora_amoeboformis.AAC.1